MPTADGEPARGPEVSATAVTFRLADPDRAYVAVRLHQDLHLDGDLVAFTATADGWELRLDRPPLPPVARLEYLFEVTRPDGGRDTLPDPANPRRTEASGGRSVVEFPGYRPPAWLDAPVAEGTRRELEIAAPSLGTPIRATLWSPARARDDVPLPLLVAHD